MVNKFAFLELKYTCMLAAKFVHCLQRATQMAGNGRGFCLCASIHTFIAKQKRILEEKQTFNVYKSRGMRETNSLRKTLGKCVKFTLKAEGWQV